MQLDPARPKLSDLIERGRALVPRPLKGAPLRVPVDFPTDGPGTMFHETHPLQACALGCAMMAVSPQPFVVPASPDKTQRMQVVETEISNRTLALWRALGYNAFVTHPPEAIFFTTTEPGFATGGYLPQQWHGSIAELVTTLTDEYDWETSAIVRLLRENNL
jgi:hypothetical protein